MSKRRCLSTVAMLALGLGLATSAGSASAQGRPLFPIVSQLAGASVVGAEDDGAVPAGSIVALRLAGIGRCTVDVAVRPLGARAFVHTQAVDAVLGTRAAYPLAYRTGPYAADGGPVAIRVVPRAPCRGNASEIVLRTARPRIVIPQRVPPVAPTAPASPSPSPTTAPTAPTAPSSSQPPVAPPAVPGIPGAKPATGNVGSLSVPGGSFAEDDPQKLKVMGVGGCALDLHVSNKSYGGSFDKTFAVNPMNLANGPSLYNGTHFDTLAEGSYHADVTGKNGCTGTAAIDFKVTAKTSTAAVKGKPTLTLDKAPVAGSAYKKSKDSNIWFKVSVPTSFKDNNASCCDVELNYVNQYGGWEVLPNSPFSDAGMNPLANNNSAVPKSVSYFTVTGEAATKWRMRVRGYRYKTAFEWSDWVEFTVDQN